MGQAKKIPQSPAKTNQIAQDPVLTKQEIEILKSQINLKLEDPKNATKASLILTKWLNDHFKLSQKK